MGGTSTDVSRYNGEFEHTYESITAGVTIQTPQVRDFLKFDLLDKLILLIPLNFIN